LGLFVFLLTFLVHKLLSQKGLIYCSGCKNCSSSDGSGGGGSGGGSRGSGGGSSCGTKMQCLKIILNPLIGKVDSMKCATNLKEILLKIYICKTLVNK
jgi:hypothetical protein